MATIYEVSALSGVSKSTVSRVLNDHANVSEKTKQKVMDAVKQLHYRPNSTARSLATNRSNSVGVLVSELHGPFYGDMLTAIEIKLRAAGKHAIIAAGHSDAASEIDGIEFLIERSCDALILHVDAVSDEYLIGLSKNSIPFVLINRYIEEIKENCICLDNELGGYLASKYLIDQGHRDIAYISGPLWKKDAGDRISGHKRALAEANIDFNAQLLFEADFKVKGGCDGMSYFIAQKQKFTALACANDEMASGAMKVARENGIKVPSDCSIIGFDNVFFTEYLYPQLTTVNFPIKEIALMAVRWILKNEYKTKDFNINNVFEPTIIARESVQYLPSK